MRFLGVDSAAVEPGRGSFVNCVVYLLCGKLFL